MAGESVVGLSLGTDFLKNLEKADKKMNALINKGNQASKSIISAFQQMNSQGVVPFVQGLEKQKQMLDSVYDAIITKTGKARKGYEDMAKSVVDTTNVLTNLISQMKSTSQFNVDSKVMGLSQQIKELQEYQERQRIVREANANAMNQELNSYKQIIERVKELNSIKSQAKDVKSTSTDTALVKDANKALREANAELKILKEQQKKIEQKYAVETALIRKQADTQSFQDKVKIASEAATAVEREVKREKDAYLKSLSDRIKAQQEYQQRLRDLEEARARQQSRNRQASYNLSMAGGNGIASADNAINYANRIYSEKGLKSLNNMNLAIQKMQQAQQRLNLNTEQGRQKYEQLDKEIKRVKADIDRVTGSSEKLKKSHSKLLDTSGQLARAMAAVFSVSAIRGYVNKIVSVRGEFEMQHRSLQILIGDLDEANVLWDKTIALAVKSPFRVKELVSYTKQLAAYRVESEKLYDTTRMLADVSAGLGVDMQRLILAYGQVKAANFLRGTELRQFSEAGVNMLGELAEYFSELEGRAVSVGDVFERVSKRLVTFEDVHKIFERITGEGGVFYKMQEQQSETLRGQMMNLRDSIDLMLNEIGKERDGQLKSIVSTIRFLVENWREFEFILKKVVISYAAFKAVNATYTLGMKKASEATLWFNKGLKAKVGSTLADIQTMTLQEAKILGVTRAQYVAGKATMYLQGAIRGVGAALKVMIPIALAGFVMELWRVTTKASREAERLREELNSIVSGDVSNLDKTIDRYNNLATRLSEVNKGSDAHKEIINKLNSEYGEYLNFVVTEETTIKNLADAYEDVVKIMKEKQALASFEKGMDAIAQSYGNALTEAKDNFYDLFEGASVKSRTNEFKFLVPTEKEIDDIYAIVQQKAKELNADQLDSLKEQGDLIQDVVSGYYGEDFFLSRDFSQSIELLDILVERKEKEKELQEEINAQYKEVLSSREAQLEKEKLQNEYAEKRRKIEEELSGYEKEKALAELADKQELEVIDLKLRFNLINEQEAIKQKDAIINWAKGTIADINNRLKNELGSIFSEEELSKVLFTRHIKDGKTINDYLKDITNNWKQQNEIIAEQISLKSELGSLDEANENILKTALRKEELYRSAAELLGVELKYTERLSEEARNAINAILPEEYQISLEQAYGGIDKIIADLKKEEAQHLNIIEQINERKKEGLPFNEQELKDAEDAYWWTKKRLDLIDPKTKTPISEGKVNTINAKLEEKYQIDAVGRTKDEVTLLSEANSEKEKAIAYEKQLNAQKEQGHKITKEELDAAKTDVEQYTLRWKLLGGTEKETTGGEGRSNSLYDERIKVIDDMNKKYQELNKTLDKSASLQGAFDAYIDAFADAYKGIKWIPENVKQMTAEEFTKNVLNFPDENDLVKFLDTLANEPMKTFEKIKVELAKGEFVMDIDVNKKQLSDKALIEDIKKMFNNYEISLELEKLNIPSDVADRLFGVKPVDLSDIRKKIEAELKKVRLGGGQQDLLKDLESQLEKVEELEEKALEERLKRYAEFLEKGQTERVKIKLNELRELEKLEEDFANKKIDEEDYKAAKAGIKQESRKKIDVNEWEMFKESEIYSYMFEDLENVGTRTVESLLEKLEGLKDSLSHLPADKYKEIVKEIEKLESIKLERNPFKFLETAHEDLQNFKKFNAKEFSDLSYKGLQDVFYNSQDRIKEMQDENDLINIIIRSRKEGNKLTEEEAKKISKNTELLSMQDYELQSLREGNEALIESEEDRSKSAKEGMTNYEKFALAVTKVAQHVQAWGAAFNGVLDGIDSILDAFGVAEDSSSRIWIESTKQIANMIVQVVMLQAALVTMGVTANAALGVIGVIATALTAVGAMFSAIFQAHDKGLEKRIQRWKDYVERLERQYQKLEKAIDNAYEATDVKLNVAQSRRNINDQIRAYQNMIQAEKDKKKTDEKKIQEYYDAIADLREQEKEMMQETIEGFGGSYDFRSTTREFVDAWVDAFKETGNGLFGLQEEFSSFFSNVIAEQAVMQGASTILKPVLDSINSALSGDYTITDKEFNAIGQLQEEQLEKLDEFLEGWYGRYGDYLEVGELSGLQRGIEGVSESTAQIIEALLNSMRFYVADSNTQLKTLVAAQLGSNDANTPNPMLAQLQIVAKQTTAIYELFDSVVGTGHPRGRSGVRVFID